MLIYFNTNGLLTGIESVLSALSQELCLFIDFNMCLSMCGNFVFFHVAPCPILLPCLPHMSHPLITGNENG